MASETTHGELIEKVVKIRRCAAADDASVLLRWLS
jgi:hypothetical protein